LLFRKVKEGRGKILPSHKKSHTVVLES